MNPDCDTQLSLCGDWARTPPIFGHKILSSIFVYSIKYTESQLNWTVWTNHGESIWKSYRKLEWWSINRFHYSIYICYQIFPSLIKSLMHPFPRYHNDVNSTQTPVSFKCASTSLRVSLIMSHSTLPHWSVENGRDPLTTSYSQIGLNSWFPMSFNSFIGNENVSLCFVAYLTRSMSLCLSFSRPGTVMDARYSPWIYRWFIGGQNDSWISEIANVWLLHSSSFYCPYPDGVCLSCGLFNHHVIVL